MFIAAGVFGVPRYEHRRPSMPRELGYSSKRDRTLLEGGWGIQKAGQKGGGKGMRNSMIPTW